MHLCIVVVISVTMIFLHSISAMQQDTSEDKMVEKTELVPITPEACDCSANFLEAAANSCLTCCERLFKAKAYLKAHLNITDDGGATPLHVAILDYHPENTPIMVKDFLAAGADPMIQDGDKYLPLHSAVTYARPEIVRLLFGEELTQEEMLIRYCQNDNKIFNFLLCLKRKFHRIGAFPKGLRLYIIAFVGELNRIQANQAMMLVENDENQKPIQCIKNAPEILEMLKKYEPIN